MAISADLGEHLEAVVNDLVANGRYNSKSEVLREGVRLVEEREARIQPSWTPSWQAGDRRCIDAGRVDPADEVFARAARTSIEAIARRRRLDARRILPRRRGAICARLPRLHRRRQSGSSATASLPSSSKPASSLADQAAPFSARCRLSKAWSLRRRPYGNYSIISSAGINSGERADGSCATTSRTRLDQARASRD